jgi:glycosyltransferase involved in cell wall biosynthesis
MSGKSPCIVFINHWAKHLGGAERSLIDILAFLSNQCTALLITSESGPLTREAQAMGVTCSIIKCSLQPSHNSREHFARYLLTSWREVISFFQFVYKMCRLIKSIRPDLIHANVPKSHAALFLLTLAGFRGISIFHIREIFDRHSLPYSLYRFLFPYKHGVIIAISESVKAHLPRRLQQSAIVLHNGVVVPQTEKVMDRPPSSQTRFLYLGRIVPWKGCEDLVHMFAMVKNQNPLDDCSLSLIGGTIYWDPDYRRQLMEKIRQHGLLSHCFLHPHTEEVRQAMHSHDVFCNASFREPFGRSLAEAQAEGLPVIAFDSGGIREIVKHEETGILVPFGDKRGFAKAMERLMHNKEEARQMGMKGHERMKKYFNRDIQIPKIGQAILTYCSGNDYS